MKNRKREKNPFLYSWEQKLFNYRYCNSAINELEDSLETAKAELTFKGIDIGSFKSGKTDGSKFDNNVINLIAEIDHLENKLKLVKKLKEKIERILKRLSEENKKIICEYYFNGKGINWIMNEFYLSRSGAYEKKDIALNEFLKYLYVDINSY